MTKGCAGRALRLSLLIFAAHAAAAPPEKTTTDSAPRSMSTAQATADFVPPTLLSSPVLRFPNAPVRDAWVEFRLVADQLGQPQAIAISRSSGEPAFTEHALDWMRRVRFTPAIWRAKPVPSSIGFRVLYQVTDFVYEVRPALIGRYERAVAAIDAGNRAEAARAITDLRANTFDEGVYVSFAEAHFAGRWGSEQQQVEALERAMQGQIYGDALPQSLQRAALQMLLRLHVRRQDFGRARATLAQLDPDLRALPANLKLNEDLTLLVTDARAFKTAGQLYDDRAWLLPLLKRRFVVRLLEGSVETLRLRCDRGYAQLPFDADTRYETSDAYGNCELEVGGSPGTRFEVVQS